MKRLDEITIADLMPDSISRDAQVSATARAIDPQLRLISEAVDRPLILPAIDDLSAGVLEHLAVQYDVTAWDSAWPIDTKRAVLKTAIADKRKMGTRGAVQRAIEAVAPIATITEWWQDPDGDMPPHTFKIDLLQEESAVDAETQANVIAQVNEAKPVRSHYTFTAIQQAGSGFYFAGVLRAIAYARVRSAGITIEQTNIQAGICAALRGMNIRRLLASSHMGDMPEPVVPDVALFGGDFSGNNIRMESVDGGGGLIDKYASYKALFELRGWEPGGLFIDKPRMMGICGALTETSDSVVLVEVAKQLSVGRIEFTGSLAEGGIPESGVVEEYIPEPVLPTVETNLGAYGTVQSGTKNLAPNDIGVLYLRNASTTAVIYDDNYLYSVYRYYYDVLGASEWRIGAFFEAVKDGTALAAKNITNSTIDYIGLYRYATCSDTQAEVITVLNSSNESFNAFKYTVNNTDYYYVLDNTQTDWTDDLSSIGYHLPPATLTAYFNPGQGNDTMSVTNSWSTSGDQYAHLYPLNSSSEIPYDSTKTYTVKSILFADGREVTDADVSPYTVGQYIKISDLNYASRHMGVLILRTRNGNRVTGTPSGCRYTEE